MSPLSTKVVLGRAAAAPTAGGATLAISGTNSAMTQSHMVTMFARTSASEPYELIEAVDVAPDCTMIRPKRKSLGKDSVAALIMRITAKLHGLKNRRPGAARDGGESRVRVSRVS